MNNRTKMGIAIVLIISFAVMECGAAVAVYSVANPSYEYFVRETERNDSLSIPNTERNDDDGPVDSRGGGGVPYNGVDDPLMREANGSTVTGGLTSTDSSSYEAKDSTDSGTRKFDPYDPDGGSPREVRGEVIYGELCSADFSSFESYEKYYSGKEKELGREDFASEGSYNVFLKSVSN